jgi:hypothetical protein
MYRASSHLSLDGAIRLEPHLRRLRSQKYNLTSQCQEWCESFGVTQSDAGKSPVTAAKLR